MEGKPGVLQHRIEAVAVGRRPQHAQEGIGCHDDE